MLDRNIGMRNEIEYFWNKSSWAVSAIPDPTDDDPARYAVLSCIPHLLVAAFNKNIELGLPRDAPAIMSDDEVEELKKREKKFEAVPEWTSKVPPLEKTLKIPYTYDGDPKVLADFDDERASTPFKEKKVLIWEPHIYFI